MCTRTIWYTQILQVASIRLIWECLMRSSCSFLLNCDLSLRNSFFLHSVRLWSCYVYTLMTSYLTWHSSHVCLLFLDRARASAPHLPAGAAKQLLTLAHLSDQTHWRSRCVLTATMYIAIYYIYVYTDEQYINIYIYIWYMCIRTHVQVTATKLHADLPLSSRVHTLWLSHTHAPIQV